MSEKGTDIALEAIEDFTTVIFQARTELKAPHHMKPLCLPDVS
jgi:hypothetical protein